MTLYQHVLIPRHADDIHVSERRCGDIRSCSMGPAKGRSTHSLEYRRTPAVLPLILLYLYSIFTNLPVAFCAHWVLL